MKVCYFTSQYPKVSHTFIRREIAGVEESGIEVLRVSVRRSGEQFVDWRDRAELERTRVLLDGGVRAVLPAAASMSLRHPLRTLRALRTAVAMGWKAPQGLLRHLAYLAEACLLLRWMRAERVDHIHVHFSTNPSDVALLCRELGGPPFSFTAHRVEAGAPSSSSIARKLAAASFAVAICEEGRGRLLAAARPEDVHKVRLVRCGVDEHFLRAAPSIVPEAPRLVCVARLSPEKGIFVLLRAAQRLVRQDVRFELSLLGDGPDRAALELEAGRLGLDGCVRFEGWASRDTVEERVRGSRALVLPSFGEGLPVVIMEALALRRPVIATRVNGVPELVEHGRCGWLVTPGSDGELFEAMRDALTRPATELDAMGALGAERVATMHNPVEQVRVIAQLLRDICPNATGSATHMH